MKDGIQRCTQDWSVGGIEDPAERKRVEEMTGIESQWLDSNLKAEDWLRQFFRMLSWGQRRIDYVIAELKAFRPVKRSVMIKRRQLNEMFDISNDLQLIKRSNNQAVPEDEPLFIFRARDALAIPQIRNYIQDMVDAGCDDERIKSVRAAEKRFLEFAMDHPERMKQPGVTKGR